MKRIYIKPELEVLDVEIESYMLGLSSEESLPGTGNGGDSEGGMDADGNRYRGEWGNLWAED